MKSKSLLALSLAALLLTGCEASTEQKDAFHKRLKDYKTEQIVNDTVEVCVRGNTYLYLPSGNTSQLLLLLDKDSKVIPCKEAEQ